MEGEPGPEGRGDPLMVPGPGARQRTQASLASLPSPHPPEFLAASEEERPEGSEPLCPGGSISERGPSPQPNTATPGWEALSPARPVPPGLRCPASSFAHTFSSTRRHCRSRSFWESSCCFDFASSCALEQTHSHRGETLLLTRGDLL